MVMVPDPYKALNLPHTATGLDIKKSYRDLARQYHPDRLFQQQASQDVSLKAQSKFADMSAAYALLSDTNRKARYDHIYKFGGYDDPAEEEEKRSRVQSSNMNMNMNTHTHTHTNHRQQEPSGASKTPGASYPSRKRKSMGIGYACTDPLAFVWTQGKVQTTKTMAGIQIPTRLQMAQPSSGLRFAYSSGQFSATPCGLRKYISHTTQFACGKKYTRTETTIVHPDGRKEVVIEGDDDTIERRYSTVPVVQMRSDENVSAEQHDASQQLPWYIHAWQGIKDKLSMCTNPCNAVAAQ
jgi:curved DNA-binding protein CbpA